MPHKGRLITLIENSADELTKKWMGIVRNHPDMPTYRNYDEGKLYERAFSVYSQVGKWLSDETTKEEIQDIYVTLGRERREEGFKLSELFLALVITRRVLWIMLPKGDLLEDVSSLYDGLDVTNHTILFFDRAMVYAARGYEG
jgi:hypothetical protein